VLEQQGVRKITALNQPFDANLHNAIQEVENTTVPSGTIVQVLQDGYMIHDRLLRPSMVIVSRGGPKRENPCNVGNKFWREHPQPELFTRAHARLLGKSVATV